MAGILVGVAQEHSRTLYYNFEFKALPGVGHWVQAEAPERLNVEVKKFFK